MSNKLIIVADAKQAKFFNATGLKITEMKEVLPAPEHHHARQALRQGFNQKGSSPSHFFDPHTEVEEIEREEFSKIIVDKAHSIFENGAYNGVILVAPAKLLGAIRSNLTKPLEKAILKEIDKDLTSSSEEVLEQQVFS